MAIKIKNIKKGVDKASGKMYNSSCVVETEPSERQGERLSKSKQDLEN